MSQPDTDTKRQILTNKLRQYQAKAYDHEATATIADRLGETEQAKAARKTSERLYEAARETQALLDELDDPPD